MFPTIVPKRQMVPDYLDDEPDSEMGAWVDDNGVTLNEEQFLAQLQRDRALKREDLEAYMMLVRDRFVERSVTDIPEKFVQLDTDEDGYISFEELLKAIDEYFDFEVDLSIEELRQVNEYFFSQ
jgi:Ca2+-binding EF-hand superfamily protein